METGSKRSMFGRGAGSAALFSAALAAAGLTLLANSAASGQGPSPLVSPRRATRAARRTAAGQTVSKTTAQGNPTGLLHRMVKANLDYAFIGREATMNADGEETEQWVRWNPKIGLRRESIRPAVGDLLIDNFKTSYRYAQREKQWSQQNSMLSHPGGRINDVLKRIKSGDLRAEWVGQEQVAGRNADIVRVSSSMSGPAPTRKFWIDRATGIRLKSEDIGPGGRTISTSYYLSLEINPALDAHLFDAPALPAGTPIKQHNPAQKFATIDAARAAGVAVHVPDYLPAGFSLRVVESRSDPRGARLSLRYENGITLVSLIETPEPIFGHKITAQLGPGGSGIVTGPRGLRAYLWHDNASGLNYAVLSSLPDDQIKRIAESVR